MTVAIAVAACVPKASVSGPVAGQIIIDAGRPGRTVSPLLFGSNLQWEHDGDGILKRQSGGRFSLRQDVIDAARDADIRLLRFPGGALANTYRWKSAVGAVGKRGKGLSFAYKPVPSNFGSDEFIRTLHDLHAQGVVTVNVSAGPREAADWVDYLNAGANANKWGALRRKNGAGQPARVRYWEIGNELYSPGQAGHMKAEAYGKKVIEFSKAMKARDPRILIGADLEGSFLQAAWMRNVYPHLLTWNQEVLQVAGRHVDFVSVHFYAPFDKLWSDDALHELVWAGPEVFRQNLKLIRDQLRKYGAGHAKIAVSEYGTFFGSKTAPDARIASTENGLFTGLMLMAMMHEPDVVLAANWSLINNSRFGMLATDGGRIVQRPTYEVMRQMSRFAGSRLLPVNVQVKGYRVDAKGNIPALKDVPYLEAVAAKTANGTLRIAVVNRSPTAAVDTALRFSGAAPATFQATVLKGADDGKHWQRHGSTPVHSKGGVLRVRFPAYSITFLEGGGPRAR